LSTFIPEIETKLSNVVLVQDEAHNVPSTALDSASDSLTLGIIRQAMREGTKYNDSLSKQFCRGLAKSVLALSSEMDDNEEILIKPMGIMSAALENSGVGSEEQPLVHMEDLGANIKIGLLKAGKFPRSTIFRVAKFMQRWISYSERADYAFILKSEMRGRSRRVSLDLDALDPTSVTQPILSMIRGSVAISGTLSPLEAYAEMLGFGDSAVRASFRSPFALKNRTAIIVDGVGTSYKSRGRDVYSQMVEHCAAAANATPGNTGIFTTSYHIGRSLLKMGLEKKLDKKLFLEEQGMKSSENDQMIKEFKNRANGKGAVLLGVQGGRNSEGGDFPGETMECVVVVGVPYAKPLPRIDALIGYFDKRFNNRGRDYAYVLPAVTRATQAAGRPVRRLDDRGAIILLDQRFATPYLRRFLPSWLEEITTVVPNSPKLVSDRISEFFAS
jgi:DNA excision repair protein ERCC-2